MFRRALRIHMRARFWFRLVQQLYSYTCFLYISMGFVPNCNVIVFFYRFFLQKIKNVSVIVAWNEL